MIAETTGVLSGLFAASLAIIIIFLFVVIGFYVAEALILNRLYYFQEGKKTILGWIPLANIYLTGRVTTNKTGGWVLLGLYFVSQVLDNSTITSIYSMAYFVLFIYACVKYSKLNKEYKNGTLVINAQTNNNQQNQNNMQQQMNMNQSNMQQNPMNVNPNYMQQPINNMPQNNMQQPVNNQMSGQQPQQVNSFCPTCGTQIAPGTAFCQNCGSKISQ